MASGDDAATTRTEFAIRYFPHPDEDAFESFAPIEQATRGSTLFDATGTPTVEEFDTIEPSLFHVATLALSPSRALLNIDFAAQDCWLETDTADEAVAVRRAVRGFELGAPVLDLLIGAHAYYGRTPPRGVEILREPGLRWHVNGNGVAASTIAAEVSLLTVHVRGLLRYGAALGAEVTAEPTPPLVPSAGQACVFRHYGRDAPPHFDGLDLATWWRAAVWQFIPSGLFCGCQAEDLSIAGRDEADTCVAAHGQLKALP